MAYVRPGRGMGDTCGAGFTSTGTNDANGNLICASNADYAIGAPCFSGSFPFVGTYDSSANCSLFPQVYGYVALGLVALVFLKGRR